MNLPNPPTDNLYKFVAIFGLVVFISTGILAYVLMDKINNEAIQYNSALDADTAQMNILGQDYQDITLALKSLPNPSMQILNNIQQKLDDYRNQRESTNIRLAKDLASFDPNSARVQEKIITIDASIGFAVGILFSITGFILWYFKLQRYQDILIKRKAMSNK